MAGGTTGDAQIEGINLALPVYDGQRILVPSSSFSPLLKEELPLPRCGQETHW